jgi:CDP-diacylglycerol---glycerol-3-phosphate 3-phosphatidyltransferase
MIINIPNVLTLMRIVMLPLLVVIYLSDHPLAMPISALLFILAGLTDWLDGYLARKLNQQSAFGAFLDPVADKLIVATALFLILFRHPEVHILIPALIIVGREITVSALREWMAEMGRRGIVAVSYMGKLKTTLQIISIIFLLWAQPLWGLPIFEIGKWLLDIAAVLTVWSMVDYLRAALSDNKPS